MTPGETEVERTRRAILESPTGLPAGLTRERIEALGDRYGLCRWCLAEIPSYRASTTKTCGWACDEPRGDYHAAKAYRELADEIPKVGGKKGWGTGVLAGWTIVEHDRHGLTFERADTGYRASLCSGWRAAQSGKGKRYSITPDWAPRKVPGDGGRYHDPLRYGEQTPAVTFAASRGAKGAVSAFRRLIEQTPALDLWERSWRYKRSHEQATDTREGLAARLGALIGRAPERDGFRGDEPRDRLRTRYGEGVDFRVACRSTGLAKIELDNVPEDLAGRILLMVEEHNKTQETGAET